MPGKHATAVKILKVVDGAGYVVSPIHQISFRRFRIVGEKFPSKIKIVNVGLVGSPSSCACRNPGISKPRVFEAGCECCSRQIKSRAFVESNSQLCENTKGLSVSFKSIAIIFFDELMQSMFSHMTEWRVTKIVRQTCGFDYFRMNPKFDRELWRFLTRNFPPADARPGQL